MEMKHRALSNYFQKRSQQCLFRTLFWFFLAITVFYPCQGEFVFSCTYTRSHRSFLCFSTPATGKWSLITVQPESARSTQPGGSSVPSKHPKVSTWSPARAHWQPHWAPMSPSLFFWRRLAVFCTFQKVFKRLFSPRTCHLIQKVNKGKVWTSSLVFVRQLCLPLHHTLENVPLAGFFSLCRQKKRLSSDHVIVIIISFTIFMYSLYLHTDVQHNLLIQIKGQNLRE